MKIAVIIFVVVAVLIAGIMMVLAIMDLVNETKRKKREGAVDKEKRPDHKD